MSLPVPAESLKLSSRAFEPEGSPFCSFVIDDFLPRPLYEALDASFPDDPERFRANSEGKLGLRSSEAPSAFDALCREHREWRELIGALSHDDFVLDVRRALVPALVRARGIAGHKRWLNDTDRRVSNVPPRYWLFEPVRATFQLSRMPAGAEVLPHTDAPRKLVSLVLYFSDPDWRPEWGGATEFFAAPPGLAAGATERVAFDRLEPLRRADFRPNRLVGFVRSPDSWHGVRPLACPTGRARRALLINLKRLKWSKRHHP